MAERTDDVPKAAGSSPVVERSDCSLNAAGNSPVVEVEGNGDVPGAGSPVARNAALILINRKKVEVWGGVRGALRILVIDACMEFSCLGMAKIISSWNGNRNFIKALGIGYIDLQHVVAQRHQLGSHIGVRQGG